MWAEISAVTRLFDEALAHRFGDGFGLGVDFQFLVDVSHVELDRVVTDILFSGGGRIVMALDKELQVPRFMRSQVVFGTLRRAKLGDTASARRNGGRLVCALPRGQVRRRDIGRARFGIVVVID